MLSGSRVFSGNIHRPFLALVIPPLPARISWRRLVAEVGTFEKNKKVHKHLHLWPLGPHRRRLAVRSGTSKGSTISQYGCSTFGALATEGQKKEAELLCVFDNRYGGTRTPLTAGCSYFNVKYANRLKHDGSVTTAAYCIDDAICCNFLKFQSKEELSVHLSSHVLHTHTTSSHTDMDSAPAEVTGVWFPPATSCNDSLAKNLTYGWHAQASSMFGIKCTTKGLQQQERTNKDPATTIWPRIAQHFTGLLQTHHIWVLQAHDYYTV